MHEEKFVILCVDDDPDVLETLSVVLEARGYEVLTAACAEDGLSVFAQADPDLVIVDQMMEEIDAGTNFVKEARLLRPAVPPMLMLSSMGDSLAMATDYAGLGLAGLLQKPIAPKTLLRLVAAKLKLRPPR